MREAVVKLLGGYPKRPKPDVAPYDHPSDGSTLKPLQEPSGMTRGQLGSWAIFNKR